MIKVVYAVKLVSNPTRNLYEALINYLPNERQAKKRDFIDTKLPLDH